MHLSKKSKTLLGVVVLLVAARVALPYVVLHFANKTLAEDVAPYTGHIDDVDIALYRGAYQIKDLRIDVMQNDVREPFLTVPVIDFSVEWKSIFDGAFTGEVVVVEPRVVFGFGASPAQEQTGEEVDWVETVQHLMPITINRFAIEGGVAELTNVWAEPDVDLSVEGIDFEVHNIRNVVESGERLPSPFTAAANFPGYGGAFAATGAAQLLKEIPDFNYDARLENFRLTEMNDLAKHYAGVDFEKGTVSVYSELAMADGKFDGYVKPLLNDVQIFSRGEGDRTAGQYFRELFAEGAQELLENHRKDQIATRVPIEGTLENTETGVWTAVIAVLRNAYWSAFRPQLDESIDFEDALAADGDDERGFFKRLFKGGDDVDDRGGKASAKTEDGKGTKDKQGDDKPGLIKRVFGGDDGEGKDKNSRKGKYEKG